MQYVNVLFCNTIDYSIYCPFLVCTLYQLCAKMNFFLIFQRFITQYACQFTGFKVTLYTCMKVWTVAVLEF